MRCAANAKQARSSRERPADLVSSRNLALVKELLAIERDDLRSKLRQFVHHRVNTRAEIGQASRHFAQVPRADGSV
jgi:hypothetical protein